MVSKPFSWLCFLFVLFWSPLTKASHSAEVEYFLEDADIKPEGAWRTYGRAGLNIANGLFSRKEIIRPPIIKEQQQPDLSIAKTLAEFVSVSYCYDMAAVADWTCQRCKRRPGFVVSDLVLNESWNVAAYLGYYPPWKAKILVFRGTHGRDLGNWIENIKTRPHQVRMNVSLPGFDELRVHNGFSRIWNIPFEDPVTTALEHLVNIYGKEGPFYIAGHSAGGATAQLAAFTLALTMGFDDIRLYTFGSPRVGNFAFSAKLADLVSESWRFTHNRDIVPTLPWLAMGFWHSAQEVFQKEQGVSLSHCITTYRVCDGSGEDPNGHNSMCRFGFGCNSVDDHYFYLNTIMENDGTC